MRWFHVTAGLLLLAFVSCSYADATDNSETGPSVVAGSAAKPLRRDPPRYPPVQLGYGQEGWVELSFVVGTDGRVIDPVVTDSSGIRNFERKALKVVRSWTYEPATWNGKLVEQSETRTRVVFAIEASRDKRGAGKKYIRHEKKLAKLLENGDLDGAEKLLAAAFEEPGWNLYETTRLWLGSAKIHLAKSDNENALKSLRRAFIGRDFVRPATAILILKSKFSLEVQLRRFGDALETYGVLIDEAPDVKEDVAFVEIATKISDIIESDKVLATDALIETSGDECCVGFWNYDLLRRAFSFDNVEGEIESIDIRCGRHRATDTTVVAGTIWNIPASWGKCTVHFHGNKGTTFRLLEPPDEKL